MADHASYEDSVKGVYKGLTLLAVVTLIEVVISLFGKGHILGSSGIQEWTPIIYLIGLGLISLSLYKAYFIIYEFMHMGYEVKGLAASVLLPVLLLVWGIIAFFQEGNAWKQNRETVEQRNEMGAEQYQELEGKTYNLTTNKDQE